METLSERPTGYGLLAVVSIARGPAPVRRWTFQAEAEGAHDAQGEAQPLSRLLGTLADWISDDLASGHHSARAETSTPRQNFSANSR